MKSENEQRKQELLDLLRHAEETGRNIGQHPTGEFDVKARHIPPHEQFSQETLLIHCKKGERSAFGQFIQLYQNSVYNYIRQSVQDTERSLHTARDVFVEAYHKLPNFHGDISVKAWLLRIAELRLLKEALPWYLAFLPSGLVQWLRSFKDREPKAEKHDKQAGGSECQAITTLLPGYIGGELEEAEADRVEKHLAACDACCQEFEEFEQATTMIHRAGQIPAPANLRVLINKTLDEAESKNHVFADLLRMLSRSWGPISSVAVAAAFLGFVGVVILYQSQHEKLLRLGTDYIHLQTRGSGGIRGEEVRKKSLVIFTGTIVTDDLPPEVVEYVANLFSSSQTAPEFHFVQAAFLSVGEGVKEQIEALKGKVSSNKQFSENGLSIRKIIATVPTYSTAILSQTIQELENSAPESEASFGNAETTLEIYILDKP